MIQDVKCQDLNFSDSSILFLDVRSPVEFLDGHISGAINIPLFEDAEREELGILYKIRGSEVAKAKGLELVGPKLISYFNRLKEIILEFKTQKRVIIYCFRGGMRSHSFASVMNVMGISCEVLEGGYKGYRNHFLQSMQNLQRKFIVLCGLTGCGKTEILEKLIEKEIPVLDLEGIANHRGSKFGHIGLGEQPTQKSFEADLFYWLEKWKDEKVVFVENESSKIGKVVLPKAILEHIESGYRIYITASIEERVGRLEDIYCEVENDNVHKAFKTICRYMEPNLAKKIEKEILSNCYSTAIELVLIHYYDKNYKNSRTGEQDYDVSLEYSRENQMEFVEKLIKLYFEQVKQR